MSSSSVSTERSLPTLGQVVALSTTYRLLYKAVQAVPLLVISLPFGSRLLYLIFDRLTKYHTLLSLLLTVALTTIVRRLIRQSAPNTVKANEALRQTEFRLPCLMLVSSCLFANFVVSPLGDALGIQSYLTVAPMVSFGLSLRIAAGLFLLGLSVVLRYAGPPSVMRCSSSPLMANPLQTALREFASKFTVDALLHVLAGPNSDMPGGVIKSPSEYRPIARRLQQPFWTSILAQILISSSLACGVAYVSILPFFSSQTHGETPFKAAILLTSIVSTLTHLCQTALNGQLHELNADRYRWNSTWRFSSRLWVEWNTQILMVPSVLALGVAVGAHTYILNPNPSEEENDHFGSIIVSSLISGFLIYLYLTIFDETVKYLMCASQADMQKAVAEIADDDRMETYLELIMYSLLHSNAGLVASLSTPTKPNYYNLEGDELNLHNTACKGMAVTLLRKTSADERGAHLEDDILRLSILSSFGGGPSLEDAQPRLMRNIQEWIQPHSVIRTAAVRREPLVVPLVRAMCTYLGGLGEALVICATAASNSYDNPWMLPPGLLVCAIHAVRGTARFVLVNLALSTKTLADWRSTHLSMLIPVVLTSLHGLESGMVRFVQATRGGGGYAGGTAASNDTNHLEKIDLFRTECRDLLPLYEAINEAAMAILERLSALEGVRRVSVAVQPDCVMWVDSILDRIASGALGALPPHRQIPMVSRSLEYSIHKNE